MPHLKINQIFASTSYLIFFQISNMPRFLAPANTVQYLIQHDMAGETETGRYSIQRTPLNSSSANGGDDDQPQPLNLTKGTDPYEFIDSGSLHENGKYTL